MLGEVLKTYTALREQAKSALFSRSTRLVIAQHRAEEQRPKYLYLHPCLWEITGLHTVRSGMLPIALPYASDPEPLRTLARSADAQLREWLRQTATAFGVTDQKSLQKLAQTLPSLEQEVCRGTVLVA